MSWYQVTKTINGRKYLYWQKTYRVGSSVKTLNKYIGPANNPPRMPSVRAVMQNLPEPHKELRAHYDAGKITKLEYLEGITAKPAEVPLQPPTVAPQLDTRSCDRPLTPEGALEFITPFTQGIDPYYVRQRDKERRDDERIQYGPMKARLKRQLARIRAAKNNTKGIKALNPFLALGMKRK
jgi:hypothetical protein